MIKDLTGMKFGRLTVIRLDRVIKRRAFWICRCECGNEKSIYSNSLKCGDSLSCGCLQREMASKKNTTHGMSRTKLYKQWHDIKMRCFNESNEQYKDYGGRGITICQEWNQGFQAFYEWAMENGFKQGLTIDRKDNNGNYEPNNCKWSTRKEQGANRRTNRIYVVNGQKDILLNLCKAYGVHMDTVSYRLKIGMTIEDALTMPLQQGTNIRKAVEERNKRVSKAVGRVEKLKEGKK